MNYKQIFSVIYVGVFATGLASLLYAYANRYLYPSVCSLSAVLQPLVICILGAMFLDEHLSTQQILTSIIIIVGVLSVLLGDSVNHIDVSTENLRN